MQFSAWILILICVNSVTSLLCENDNCNNDVKELKKYEPNWKSLDTRPLPDWYDDYKIGIFIHWGVYSVPAFGSEWFWINWKKDTPKYVEFMKNVYKPGFTYQEFAKDFTAELFNATKWSLMFEKSGARYVVLTSKHHDGYALWPSKRSFSWNSVDVGPKRDIIRELSDSIRKLTGMKFGLYYSLFEWFNRMYLDDKNVSFKTQNYVKNKVLPELYEIIENYKPEVVWSDGDWETGPEYWNSTEFISWLYNDSPVRETVVTNDRWGSGILCKHGDFFTCQDRYNPGVLIKHKWENAFTLDKTSWGQRFDTDLEQYMTSKEVIKEIVTTVACNGNVLINVGPTKYGTIPVIFEERLNEMGKWLKINGEAIYSTKPWKFQNDSVTEGVWYTMKKTKNSAVNLYAIILDYPYDTNQLDLHSLGGLLNKKSTLSILGFETFKLQWNASETALHIDLPPKNLLDKNGLDLAWTIKINLK